MVGFLGGVISLQYLQDIAGERDIAHRFCYSAVISLLPFSLGLYLLVAGVYSYYLDRGKGDELLVTLEDTANRPHVRLTG